MNTTIKKGATAYSLTAEEVASLLLALETAKAREYAECLGPRGGFKETKNWRDWESLQKRLEQEDDQ